MRTVPSTTEYSLWQRRCMKVGCDMGSILPDSERIFRLAHAQKERDRT
jgi:hypothetical protein